MTKTEHTRFVQSVRYSPNGDLFATGGFDGKVFIYDGKTSDLIGELGQLAFSYLKVVPPFFFGYNYLLFNREPCPSGWSLRRVVESR